MPILDSRPLSAPEDVRVLREALGRVPDARPCCPRGAEAMRAAAAREAKRASTTSDTAPPTASAEPHRNEPVFD